MFLSIIIPHYNLQRELLERCLHSIMAQKMPTEEYEIIIVDDASDIKPTWATELGTNIRLIESEHRGPGGARNVGIENAQGEYIMFVDGDDCLVPDSAIHACIEKLRQERPHILRYNYVVKQENDSIEATQARKTKFSNTISGAIFMERNNLSGSSWTFFFQREFALKKNIKFPENIFHEDEEFNTILHFHAQSLIISDATLYCYCIRGGSTTANKSKDFERKRISDLVQIIERIHHFAQRQNGSGIQKRGITHKLDMLCVDAILNMLFIGMKAKEIRQICRTRLAPIQLYPLRKAGYSLKYRIFRKFANSRIGMTLLRIMIPSKKPAKK